MEPRTFNVISIADSRAPEFSSVLRLFNTFRIKLFFTCLVLTLATSVSLFAQKTQSTDTVLTLQDAIKIADTNYPAIRAKTSKIKAARYNLKLQRQNLIPELDIDLQSNISTLNNINGLMYPQNAVLPISGPVTNGNSNNSVWGSAAGIQLSWEPFSFGERDSKIRLGKSSFNEAKDELNYELFNHTILLIDGWLNYLTSISILRTEQVNVDRTLSLYSAVKSLTISGLRPGVDSFIVKGEISKAKISLNKAISNEKVFKINLAELLGTTDTAFAVSRQNILTQLPIGFPSAENLATHPALKLYESKLEVGKSKLIVIKHLYHPKLTFFASSFARGSGANTVIGNDYSLKGLRFSKYNHALGVTLSLPILQFFPDRTKTEIQKYNLSSLKSSMNVQHLKLKQAEATAIVNIQTAIKNYAESETQLTASEEAYKEMQVRYTTGLTTLTELFQIQYALVKAEQANAIALIMIWKSYLLYSQATGNINFFLNQVK